MGFGLFGELMLITPFLLVGALMVTIVLISIVPMFGMQLGEHYFHKFVVAPIACQPVKSRTALLQEWSPAREKSASVVATATCVALSKNETQVASGREIVSTSTAIVLFEPVSAEVRRVTISELTVQPIANISSASRP